MFQQGKFLTIQARDSFGDIYFIKVIAVGALARDSRSDDAVMSKHTDPFSSKIWYPTDDISEIIEDMRIARLYCGRYDLDPNSLKIVVIKTSVQSYLPERDSEEEIELRKFILEKLTEEEREILRLTNWEVFHKLADRSSLEPDSD